MSKIAEVAALGFMYQQSGDLPQAEQIYRKVLAAEPGNLQAAYLLGLVCQQQAKHADAIQYFSDVARREPGEAEFQQRLGMSLGATGKFDQAIGCFRQAIALAPTVGANHFFLGNALADQGNLAEAVVAFQAALTLAPEVADIHENLGATLARMGKADESLAHFRKAVEMKPMSAQAHGNLGTALANLGKFDEAIECHRKAVELDSQLVDAHHNLGATLTLVGDYGPAIESLRKAIAIDPKHLGSRNALGAALMKSGHPREALAEFEGTVQLEPKHPDAHMNSSLVRLLLGDLENGFVEHEWRWAYTPMRQFGKPLWDGSPLQGRTILLHSERGLGDTIQFVRYAPLIKQQGARVIVEAQPSLVPILQSLLQQGGIDRVVPQGGDIGSFDVHAPLLSIPRIVGTKLDKIPANIPYLFADDKRIEQWRGRLGSDNVFRVGIAWQGNPDYREDRERSIPLRHFAKLASPNVRLFSLQKGANPEQLREFSANCPIVDFGDELDRDAPFLDTAALMRSLDLVITSDSAIPHLAGALGAPTWVALPLAPDWRWLLDRQDSPWYPSLRLFRQEKLHDWDGVFERIADSLAGLLHKPRIGSISIEVPPADLIERIARLRLEMSTANNPDDRAGAERQLAVLAPRARVFGWTQGLAGVADQLERTVMEATRDRRQMRELLQTNPPAQAVVELARTISAKEESILELKDEFNRMLGG